MEKKKKKFFGGACLNSAQVACFYLRVDTTWIADQELRKRKSMKTRKG